MKYLLPFLLLAPALAVSVSVTPEYVRMPVGSNQSLQVRAVGEGSVYELKLYAPYLSWQTQKLWVGPSGKTLDVVFSPLSAGEYTITADLGGARAEATAVVYESERTDLWERIQALRTMTDDPVELAKLDEAERLYNESRFQLAELELREVAAEEAAQPSSLPKLFLAAVVAIVALFAAKLLLG